MNSLQSELYREINSYLAPKDRLVFSTSTIYSTSFCYEKELRKYILKRHESAKLLIPFNGWGAFIMGLLLAQGVEYPFYTLASFD